jgi:hypothetical protein
MTTAIKSLNPEELPTEVLIQLSDLAETIWQDVLSSDKYEDILDDICEQHAPLIYIWRNAPQLAKFRMRMARQLRRHLILVLLDETQ